MQAKRNDDRKMIPVRGHPSIYKRDGRFVHVWKHEGRQHKSYHRTLSEAKRAKAKRASGDTAPVSRERFDAYAREWAASTSGRTDRGLTETTRASYKDAIKRKAIPYFGSKRLADIRSSDIKGYIKHLEAEGLKPATVRRYVAPVRALLATALEDHILQRNPAAGVRVVVQSDERRHRPKSLTPAEYRALLTETPEHWRLLVEFLALTGARIGEALAAKWGDLEGDTWHIPDAKTDAGVRTVRLTPDLRRRLAEARLAAPHSLDGDAIFTTPSGTPADAHNFRKVFRAAAKRAGLVGADGKPWATPHKLRHSAASLLFEAGWTVAQVAAQLGHTDPSFTLRTYVHENEAGDVSVLEAALGS
jgi:integrase